MNRRLSLPSYLLAGALLLVSACGGGTAAPADSGSAVPAPPPSAPPSPPSDGIPPTIPQSVTAVTQSATAVSISWSAASDNVAVAGYRIYRNGNVVGTSNSTSYLDTGLTPATNYVYGVAAFDAAGNSSAPVAAPSVQTMATSGRVISASQGDYLSKLGSLQAGDTLLLAAGVYDNPNDVPGLPVFNLNGTAAQPITITGPETGPKPVFLGRSTHNTIRFDNASYVVVRNVEVDGRDLGGDGVNAQGVSHHITVENLTIRGVGGDQLTVGISTNGATTWNWIIRRNTIIRAGTGMYLGSSTGGSPFVAGIVENNLVVDTLGYSLQIKHQNPRPTIAGMPTGKSTTIIRNNVFSKANNAAGGSMARPNLLVGHFPTSGPGMDDVYDIYGNFLHQNPTEALFQGEGNVAFHDNVLINDVGDGVNIQPHNDVPRMIRVFSNTVVARDRGIRVSGGSTSFTQIVTGNAVLAATPISVSGATAVQVDNVTDQYSNAGSYLNNPTAPLGQLDVYPKPGALKRGALPTTDIAGFVDWDRDFNARSRDWTIRGAYAGEGVNPGWQLGLSIKP